MYIEYAFATGLKQGFSLNVFLIAIQRKKHKITNLNQFCLWEQIFKNSIIRQPSPSASYLDHRMMGCHRRGRSPSVVLLFDGISSRYPYICHLYRTQQHLAKTLEPNFVNCCTVALSVIRVEAQQHPTKLCQLLLSCSVDDLWKEVSRLAAGTSISDIQVFRELLTLM